MRGVASRRFAPADGVCAGGGGATNISSQEVGTVSLVISQARDLTIARVGDEECPDRSLA